MKPRKRHSPRERQAAIMRAALDHARTVGYQQATREGVAEAADCSAALVTHYWGTVVQLRRAIMRAAVAGGDLAVLAQGLAAGDEQAHRAPEAMRRAALEALMTSAPSAMQPAEGSI